MSVLTYWRKNHEHYWIRSSAAQGGLLLWVTLQAGSLLSSTDKKLALLRRAFCVKKPAFLTLDLWCRDWIPQRINKAGKFSLARFKKTTVSLLSLRSRRFIFVICDEIDAGKLDPRHRLCVGQDQAGREKIVGLETILDRSFHPPSSLAFFPENFFCI